jgi:predicted DNA-binding transcriptional regulator AlpA
MFDDDELDEVLRLPAVKKATGMCTSEIYDGMAKDTFPKSFLLEPDGRAVGWSKREIVAHQKARKAARNA